MNSPPEIRQQDAQALASGYSPFARRLEIASIVVFALLMVALVYRLRIWAPIYPWLVLTAATLGYLAADFISGFVHWMADTWGTPEWRYIGKTLIRPFREHHVDPEAITHHDFVEINGNNCLVSLLPLAGAVILPIDEERPFNLFFATFIGSMVLWVLGTNQFHKWAHLKNPPWYIALLQRVHFILPPAHHAIHHTPPFNKYYSITTGWLNKPLLVIRFYPAMEALVTWVTGALPRADDIGEAAAREIAAVVPPEETEPLIEGRPLR